MQSHVDCSFAAGAADNEGVDFPVPRPSQILCKPPKQGVK